MPPADAACSDGPAECIAAADLSGCSPALAPERRRAAVGRAAPLSAHADDQNRGSRSVKRMPGCHHRHRQPVRPAWPGRVRQRPQDRPHRWAPSLATALLGCLLTLLLASGVGAAPAAAASVAAPPLPSGAPAIAAPDPAALQAGARLFEAHCAGCHVGGGNIIRRGRTLRLEALQRARLADPEAIARVAAEGVGQMSGYGAVLGADGPRLVADWVWLQARSGWPRSPRSEPLPAG